MDPSALESHQSFPVFAVHDGQKKQWLDRFLSLFADVRAREGSGALLLAANGFLLLTAYYILKPLREALILFQAGPEVKMYMSAGQALVLLFLVPAYGAFASRHVRIKLISWVTLFFASHLVVFAALGSWGIQVGKAYYLWVGILNYLLIGQFWAFGNDLYDERKGKRLFPLVGVGTALGGVAGAHLELALLKPLGPYGLMLVAGAILVATVLLGLAVNRHESSRAGSVQQRIAGERISGSGGFRLVRGDRYLLLIAALAVMLNLVNNNGEYLMAKLAEIQSAASADRLQFFGEFSGRFYSLQNTLVLVLQAFVVSRIFRYLGVRAALFFLPLIALGGYATALVLPVLNIVRVVKGLENSTDYSIQNTARQALFLPTSREAKYKAKMAIDTFFTRSGDVLSAVVVFIGFHLAMAVKFYAALNIVFVGVWLTLVVAIARRHRVLTGEPVPLPSPLSAPDRPSRQSSSAA